MNECLHNQMIIIKKPSPYTIILLPCEMALEYSPGKDLSAQAIQFLS